MNAKWRSGVLFCLVLLFGWASNGAADFTASLSYSYSDFDTATYLAADSNYYMRVTCSLPNQISFGDEGTPDLPTFAYKYSLPEGQEVSGITVSTRTGGVVCTLYNQIYPVQTLMPTRAGAAIPAFVPPDSATYAAAAYPVDSLTVTCADPLSFAVGMGVGTLIVRPVQYRIAQNRLYLYTDLYFTIHTTSTGKVPVVAEYRSTFSQKQVVEHLRGLVKNPAAVEGNLPLPIIMDYNNPFYPPNIPPEFIIITSNALESQFASLKQWKWQRGMPTQVYTVEDDIYPNYALTDNAEEVRQFIYDRHRQGAQYVLLAGNMDHVPIRYVRTPPGEIGIISDLYYACLNGDWNFDGDGIWGEYPQDSVDIDADVYVGRVAFSGDANEVATWVNKLKTYVDNPGFGDNNYLADVVIGSADQMANSNQPQLIGNAFSNFFDIDTESLREQPSGHSPSPTSPYGEDIIDYLTDTPPGIYVNLNHGSPHDFRAMGPYYNGSPFSVVTSLDGVQGGPMRHGYIGDVQNWGKEYVHCSISCDVGALDANLWPPPGGPYPDCFAEESPVVYGGCVAGTFNTRAGWVYSSYLTEIDRMDYLCGELFQHNLALAHYATKYWGLSWEVLYGNTYFGDPSMRVWTYDPGRFDAECADVVYRDITQTVQVTVRDSATGIGLSDVLVALTKGDEVYGRDFTDVTGRAYIPIRPGTEGQLRIEASRPNFYTFVDSILVDTYCEPAVAGDANGNGVCNGLDVTFLQYYFQGWGAHPPDSCMCGDSTFLYHAADANGNCALNGVDVVFLVNYLKGGAAPRFCATCPTSRLMIVEDKKPISQEAAR